MYARVITMQLQPAAGKQETRPVQIVLDSMTTALPGFNGALLLTDPETGKAMSITLWQSEDDERAGEACGYVQQQLQMLGAVTAGPLQREQYAVKYQA